jgi:hypothetical protein
MRRWGVALLLVVTVAACGGDADERPVVADSPGAQGWEQLSEPPVPPRERTVLVSTGDDVLLVGGDQFTCPANASCMAPTEPPLADGAAFDVATGTWRPIAPAPVAFYAASTAVVGDDVYFLASTDYESGLAFLHYDTGADVWSQPPLPPGAWKQLLSIGDAVIAFTGSEERGDTGDFVFDAAAETWTALPDDPMTPAFDRTMAWADPHLYLFDKELVPNPGSEEPSIVRAARLDVGAGTWERLPDSGIIGGWSPWLVDGAQLVNPYLGSADGGEVNGWGKSYPMGGILDGATTTWLPLPDGAPQPEHEGAVTPVAGALSGTSASFADIEGQVLDASSDTWLAMSHPTGTATEFPPVVAVGRDAVAYVDGGLWRWRAP